MAKLTVVSQDLDPKVEKLRQALLVQDQKSPSVQGECQEAKSGLSVEATRVKRKEAVTDYLTLHRLEISEKGQDIHIQNGLAVLKPPYRPENLEATNVIVLDRVTSILSQMPSEELN